MFDNNPNPEASQQCCLWVSSDELNPIVLCLEPWANEISIQPNSDYLVVFEGPLGHYPAVKWSKERITVFGWPGSVAQIFLGDQVVLSCSVRVPEIP